MCNGIEYFGGHVIGDMEQAIVHVTDFFVKVFAEKTKLIFHNGTIDDHVDVIMRFSRNSEKCMFIGRAYKQ